MAQRLEAVRPNRIPPHNLDAEQSVLGAMLESKEAIANVLEIVEADHFYKPAHTEIYETIMALYGRGEAVDAITVADELTRRGKLDQIGGKPYIHGLLEAYPTAASAGHYARIVEELALLRRLIEAGGYVQELGFSMPEEVADALNDAEEAIFNVGDKRLKDDYHEIRKLLMQSMKDIETLYERGANLTGLSSGFPDLDEMTAGFQASNLIIVAARPSMGKCLAGSTLIDDPITGERVSIDRFVSEGRRRVTSASPAGGLTTTEVSDWIPNGRAQCFRLTTRTGRTIDATANHPFLMVDGWTPLEDITVGQKIAVPRKVDSHGEGIDWSNEKIRLLGYFIAEGGLTGNMPRFTNQDEEIVSDFQACVPSAFPDTCVSGPIGITYTCKAVVRKREKNSVTKWLDELGLMGKSALQKSFPESAWRFTQAQMTEFIRAIFSCDATIYGMSGYPRIEFSVASEKLALDVHHALLRFGIVSKFWKKKAQCWRVEITDPASAERYQSEIGWIGEKAQRDFKMLRERRPRSNCGHLPRDVWKYVKKACENSGISLSEMARRAGEKGWSNIHTGRGLPQRRLAIYAEILDDNDLRWLASEDLYWDEVISIEGVGERDVFDLSVPEAHNFVAQDIIVHNSSLMNDFVLNVSLKQKVPTVIFSLEMSKEEVVKRFLSSEAKVDAQRINKGALQETDWTRLSSALGRLGDAPIFVDDSANISLMEMRAKCRRLKAKHGLGMIVIDYLQLMQSPRRSENRQQEVTEISRNLKILARELKVPVVCASQLNRGVEMRSDKRPLLGDLRESGCLTGDTLVTLATGKRIPIASLVGIPAMVLSADGNDLVRRVSQRTWKVGTKDVYELRTADGRRVRATEAHPFLTPDGWMPLGDIPRGHALAVQGADSGGLSWDRFAGLRKIGKNDVYDMSVPGLVNFVANGIVCHNSIEQDADVVMFIYRDEVYNPDTEFKGEAELIIAKHRNGPTGKVRLAFMNQYTKFASIAKAPL